MVLPLVLGLGLGLGLAIPAMGSVMVTVIMATLLQGVLEALIYFMIVMAIAVVLLIVLVGIVIYFAFLKKKNATAITNQPDRPFGLADKKEIFDVNDNNEQVAATPTSVLKPFPRMRSIPPLASLQVLLPPSPDAYYNSPTTTTTTRPSNVPTWQALQPNEESQRQVSSSTPMPPPPINPDFVDNNKRVHKDDNSYHPQRALGTLLVCFVLCYPVMIMCLQLFLVRDDSQQVNESSLASSSWFGTLSLFDYYYVYDMAVGLWNCTSASLLYLQETLLDDQALLGVYAHLDEGLGVVVASS